MNDSLMPDWIKRIKDEEAAKASKRELDRQRQIAAEKTLQSDGPEFWKSVMQELKLASDSLSQIGIRANFSEIGGQGEHGCRIELAAGFPNVNPADVNAFYRSDHIACYSFGGMDDYSIKLSVNHSGQIVGVISTQPLSAPQIAQKILEPLVAAVRP